MSVRRQWKFCSAGITGSIVSLRPACKERGLMVVVFLSLFVHCSTLSTDPFTDQEGDVQESKEYCQQDYFTASCPESSVIVITSALYGRMKRGKCVQGDYGHLGCRGDALSIVEGLCTGLKTCEFRVFDSNLKETKTDCPADITAFLEASYTCLPVLSLVSEPCLGGHVTDVVITGTQPTHLASIDSEQHGYGTADCPWLLRSPAGQRLRISVIHFVSRQRLYCVDVAQVNDVTSVTSISSISSSTPLSSCSATRLGGASYTSSSNTVRLQLVSQDILKTIGRFVIKVEGVGCADPVVSGQMTVRRDSAMLATLTCNMTGQSWTLTCADSEWLGDRGNCTRAESALSPWGNEDPGHGRFPYGILLVVALGVALGIFSGGIMLTFVSMFMKRRHAAKHHYGQCATTMLPPEGALLDVVDTPYGAADVIPRDAHTAATYTMMMRGAVSHDCQSLPSPSHHLQHSHHQHHCATLKPCIVTLPPERDYQPPASLIRQQGAPLAHQQIHLQQQQQSPSLARKTTLMGSRQFIASRLDT